MRNALDHIFHLPRNAIVALITAYQKTLSPDHGPLSTLFPYGCCPHSPTCSMYGKQVIGEKGVLRGIPLLCLRLLRCNPWARISDEKIREKLEARKKKEITFPSF